VHFGFGTGRDTPDRQTERIAIANTCSAGTDVAHNNNVIKCATERNACCSKIPTVRVRVIVIGIESHG